MFNGGNLTSFHAGGCHLKIATSQIFHVVVKSYIPRKYLNLTAIYEKKKTARMAPRRFWNAIDGFV